MRGVVWGRGRGCVCRDTRPKNVALGSKGGKPGALSHVQIVALFTHDVSRVISRVISRVLLTVVSRSQWREEHRENGT
jgi:hypothetical protein